MTSPPTSTSRWWALVMTLVLVAALALVVYVSK
jgi:general stress protein CsbA